MSASVPVGVTTSRWFFSPRVLELGEVPETLRTVAHDLQASRSEGEPGVVVACASELLFDGLRLPDWSHGTHTRFLVAMDLPWQAAMRLPSRLGLHKPHVRLHVTDDPHALRRLLVAQHRQRPFEGLVDAYLMQGTLVLVLGSMEILLLETSEISPLGNLEPEELALFEIDVDGSYLHWPDHDLHLGASQLVREVDAEYLAELEIERFTKDVTGPAIARIRESRGLRQVDVRDLSERQVRRLEKGVSRLTLEAAQNLADSLEMSLDEFLTELAKWAQRLGDSRSMVGPPEFSRTRGN